MILHKNFPDLKDTQFYRCSNLCCFLLSLQTTALIFSESLKAD